MSMLDFRLSGSRGSSVSAPMRPPVPSHRRLVGLVWLLPRFPIASSRDAAGVAGGRVCPAAGAPAAPVRGLRLVGLAVGAWGALCAGGGCGVWLHGRVGAVPGGSAGGVGLRPIVSGRRCRGGACAHGECDVPVDRSPLSGGTAVPAPSVVVVAGRVSERSRVALWRGGARGDVGGSGGPALRAAPCE